MTDPDKEMARETYDRVRHGLPNHEIGIQIIEQVIRSVRQEENEARQKEINKLKYLLTGSVKANERRRRWIEKAHHQDGCTYSDNGYLKSSKCSCNKLNLEKTFAEKQEIENAIRNRLNEKL